MPISQPIPEVAVKEENNKSGSLALMQKHYSKLKYILTVSSAVLLFSLVVMGAVIAPPQRTAYAFFSDIETIDITFSTNDEVASSYLKNLLGWVEFVKNKLAIAQAFAAGIIDLKINGTDDPQVVSFSGMNPGVWGDYAFTLSITSGQQVYYVLKPIYQEGSVDLFNILSMELYNGDEHLLTAPLQDLVSWCGLFQPESSDSFTVRIQKRANQNFTDINGSTRFYLTITAVQATNNPDFCSSTNNPPIPFDLTQFNGSTSIEEGGVIRNSFVSLFAYINDPENNQVKLQVELRQLNEPFTGNDDGGILTSDLVASGSGVKVNRAELSDGAYHWRARAVDEHGNESAWQEFGDIGNTDFEIRTNELPTASFTFTPSSPEVGDEILFDASSSYDPDGTIVLYGWDWNGDGYFDEYRDTPFLNHSWLFDGTYTVGLRVVDDKNSAAFTSTTVVIGKPTTGVYSANIGVSIAVDVIPWIGQWTWFLFVGDDERMDEIDEWLRDGNGDNQPDAGSKPYEWLRGTKCSGESTTILKKACLILAMNREMGGNSGITYKDYVISVVREEQLVDKAFRNKTVDYSPSILVQLLPSIPSIFLNDIATDGVEDVMKTILESNGDTMSLFKFGSSALSLAFKAISLHSMMEEVDTIYYRYALRNYLVCRSDHDHETAWNGNCGSVDMQKPEVLLLSSGISEELLNEHKKKFDEWWIKYHDEVKERYDVEKYKDTYVDKYWNWLSDGLPRPFKSELKESIKNLILLAVKTK